MKTLEIQQITKENFAPFGDLLDVSGEYDKLINQGKCTRFHDLALVDLDGDNVGISMFHAEARALPYQLDMVERHPLGSQAFIPLSDAPFLVIVAEDNKGQPSMPNAFLTAPSQGINFHRNIWHGVLTPLAPKGIFAVIDYVGDKPNLEEFWFDTPYVIAG